MKEDVLAEHLESIRLSAARSKTLTTWILVFAVTLGATVLSEATATQRLKQERQALLSLLTPDISWQKPRSFYDRTHGLVQPYASQEADPWSQLCFFLKGTSQVAELDETCADLQDYSYALRSIAHYQNLGTPFTSLPKEALQSLNTVVHHDPQSKSFSQGFEALKRSAAEIPSSAQTKLLLEHGTSREFTPLLENFLLQDLQTNTTSESLSVHHQRLEARIKALPFGSLGEIRSRVRELDHQIAALQTSSSVTLPLIGLGVSHSFFWIAGVAVNSILLLTLLFSYQSAQGSFQAHRELSGGDDADLYRVLMYKVLMERFAIRAEQNPLLQTSIAALLLLPSVGSIVEVARRGDGFSLRLAVVCILAAINVVILGKIFTIARELFGDEAEA